MVINGSQSWSWCRTNIGAVLVAHLAVDGPLGIWRLKNASRGERHEIICAERVRDTNRDLDETFLD